MMGSEMDAHDGCDGPPIIHTVDRSKDPGSAGNTEIKLGSIPSQRFELRHRKSGWLREHIDMAIG